MIDNDWRAKATYLLDEMERRPGSFLGAMADFAKAVGIDRTTLWRDKAILERYKTLSRNTDLLTAVPNRRSPEQTINALKVALHNLQVQNGILLQNFIIISRKLTEIGIDPVTVMGKMSPTKEDNLWSATVLPWEEP